ncbi:hypothetical protein [Streptomyces sp. HNM0574]|uniref:trypsin-like serine peptidase n=1 Tax=Streptomyces sp. HNM0574 TaxID=2714954 RepID=UPI00146CE1BF|nr:hypothetical protein [Streptomyces sp. HNM0574]NLU65709.1 hypothetical protein [Streptomyces sp. HNM0574]
MSATARPARRRRPALATAAVAAVLAVTATACGPEAEGPADDKPSASETSAQEPGKDLKEELGLPDKLPKDLPTSLKDLEGWRNGEWKNWSKDDWLREAGDFINPIIDDLWDPDRMKDADENDREVDDSDIDAGESGGDNGTGEDEGVTDPTPPKVRAEQVRTPYTRNAAPVGKVFMDTPKGSMVCSGTVVKDPANPGRSNLVATAGHCVHAGSSGGWFRNVVFVPHYNPDGLPDSRLADAQQQDVAPHGVWWAQYAQTTDHWIKNGSQSGGNGAPQDFAMMKVKPENGSGKSLEETVGKAADINFNTPRVKGISTLTPTGYPAAPPFDGAKMYQCTGKPGRVTLDPQQPTMYRVGCTMTGGSSGGGWFGPGGDELLSVTSVGPVTGGWLAGPRLGDEAKGVFETVSKK